MSSDEEDQYPTIQHTRHRDLVEDDEDDVDIDDDEQYEEADNGDVMDGDEEGDDDDDQHITAWGTQKKRFYREGDEEEDEEAEEDEEEEAKLIEKLQQEQLSHENFFDVFGDQDITGKQRQGAKDIDEDDEEFPSFTLKARFKSMEDLADSEKIALIQKESPELLNIIKEFKASLKELKYKFLPLVSYLREKKATMKEGQRYLELKFNLLTSYCINLSFYILLNSQGKSVKDHPVIKRLIAVKTSLDKLKPLDKKLQGEINQILKAVEQEKELNKKKGKNAKETAKLQGKKAQGAVISPDQKRQEKNLFSNDSNGKKQAKKAENGKNAVKQAGKGAKELLGKRAREDLKKKPVKAVDEGIDDEIDDDIDDEFGDDMGDDFGDEGFGDEDDGEDEFYKKVKNMKKVKRDIINKEKQEQKKAEFKENPRHYVGEEDSRAINRKIMKNKGLTRRRGKASGNARIKHKNRYEKAQFKMKSKGHFVREKEDVYTGERHISAGKIRSTKYGA